MEKQIEPEYLEEVFTNLKYYNAMKKLSAEEKKVLYYYAIECIPFTSIAEKIGVTNEQVIIIFDKAKEDFKNNLNKLNKGDY